MLDLNEEQLALFITGKAVAKAVVKSIGTGNVYDARLLINEDELIILKGMSEIIADALSQFLPPGFADEVCLFSVIVGVYAHHILREEQNGTNNGNGTDLQPA